jgi:hypothetical protein
MRTILIALLMTLATQVGAEFMTYKDLKNLKHIEVIIQDSAKNACWTNLTESRKYAEEKLRVAGATLFRPDRDERVQGEYYGLVLEVRSRRSKTFNTCYGSMKIAISTPFSLNGRMHEATGFAYSTIFSGFSNNVNKGVIESIQEFFAQSKNGFSLE